MNITAILLAAAIVGGAGLFIGIFLGVSGKKFAVEVDEREEAILDVLPGNNCGGCGYAGCSGLAAAIAQGKADVGGCPVGGASVAGKIGEIMGVDASASERKTAFVKCGGTCEKTKSDMNIMESKTVSWQVRCRMEEQKGVHTGVSDMAHAWMPVRLMQSIL